MRLLFCFAIPALLFLGQCRNSNKSGDLPDTTTSGSIEIAVDESLKPLIAAEIGAFLGIYKNAHIEAIYTSESEAINLMLQDSTRLAIVTRRLTPEEQAVLDKVKIPGTQMTVAKGAVALILHNDNPDTLLGRNQVQGIMEGRISNWNQIDPSSGLGGIEVVFEHPNSGILRFLRDTMQITSPMPPDFFAVENSEAVINYVSKKKNALGLIGVAWISDAEDSTAINFLKTVRVAGISLLDEYFQPYQAYIAQKQYPLIRDVVVISREARAGLGTGFLTYVASDEGQRVVLKAGMVPATMPVRIVEITYE